MGKIVFLVGLSGTTSTIRKSTGAIRANPQTRALFFDTMQVVVAVGRGQGVLLDESFAKNIE
jgi:2-dehydropantoate 2-reductase